MLLTCGAWPLPRNWLTNLLVDALGLVGSTTAQLQYVLLLVVTYVSCTGADAGLRPSAVAIKSGCYLAPEAMDAAREIHLGRLNIPHLAEVSRHDSGLAV